jgi:DNA-binding beta-propeller fold protein YncE
MARLLPTPLLIGLLAGPLALGGCAASEGALAAYDSGYASGAEDLGEAGDDGGSGDDGYAPEEPEAELGRPPAATPRYVFVANTDRDTVTRIEVATLAVITAPVGAGPTEVIVSPDNTVAAVFNEGSDDLTVLDTEALTQATVGLRPNLNQIVMSGDGEWVAAWHDGALEDTSVGATSYNEVSLVHLGRLDHTPLIVGYNPRQVRFTPDHQRLLVVSDDYLSIVDLTADGLEPLRVRIAADTLDAPVAEELVLTPDGQTAIIRQFGATELVVVDLVTGEVGAIAVGDNPTDIDVTPDGTQAVAVARGSNELWIYALSDVFAEPQVIVLPDAVPFGSVLMSPDNSRGLLYSTASGAPAFAAWDRAAPIEDSISLYGLLKGVAGMALSPDGKAGIVLHQAGANGDLDSASPFYNRDALTLVDMDDYFTNPIRLVAPPEQLASTRDGGLGFLTLEGTASLLQLDYARLIHDEVPLSSAAAHLGVLPEGRTVYVSQEHPLGRISFYAPDSGDLQTITGFELNAAIER